MRSRAPALPAVLLLGLIAPGAAAAQPAGWVVSFTRSHELESFSVQAVDATRAELGRARLLTLEPVELRVHGDSPEMRRRLDQARTLLAQAERAYDNLDLADAITKLRRVAEEIDATWAEVDDPTLAADVHLRLGAAFVLDGRAREADAPFQRANLLAPGRRPDPAVYPAQVVTRFQQAIARARRGGTGSLDIRSAPSGSLVYLDGRFRGRTPLRLADVEPGTHLIRFRSPGSVDRSAAPVVRAGRTESVSARLAPIASVATLPAQLGRLARGEPGAAVAIGTMLEARTLVVLRFVPGPSSAVRVAASRHDLGGARTEPLVREAAVTNDAQGVEAVVRLALALVRAAPPRPGRAGSVAVNPAARRTPVRRSPPSTPAPAPPPSDEGGITSRWWFWTGLASVAVAGAAIAVVVATSGGDQADRPGGQIVLRF